VRTRRICNLRLHSHIPADPSPSRTRHAVRSTRKATQVPAASPTRH
jgi:hypothetical protein